MDDRNGAVVWGEKTSFILSHISKYTLNLLLIQILGAPLLMAA